MFSQMGEKIFIQFTYTNKKNNVIFFQVQKKILIINIQYIVR